MDTQEKINNYIDISRRAADAKKALQDITINWATDPQDMPFEKLESGIVGNNYKFQKIDKIKIEPKPGVNLFNGAQDSLRFVKLIELIQGGAKIIPPLYVTEVVLIDGVRTEKEPYFLDGQHRIALAQYLGLTEIPIVLMENITSYIFTLNRWSFSPKRITGESNGHTVSWDAVEALSNDGERVIIGSGRIVPRVNDFADLDIFPDQIKIDVC